MQHISRLFGWLALAALAFATLAPINLRPISGTPLGLERSGAFAVLGLLFAVGYPKHPFRVLAFVVTAAAGLEALQLMEATRHGRMPDFLVKAAGGGFGVAIGMGLTALASVRRRAQA